MKINIEKIQKSLDELDRRFNDEVEKPDVDNFQLSIYCKVAALELCGWLEETYDELIRYSLRENGIDESSIASFDKDFIKKVNGLSYKEHLRPLLINTFGFIKIVQLESEITKITSLKSTLGELHRYRNHLAHNQYIDFSGKHPINSQKPIDNPNKIKSKFKDEIYPILQEIADYLNSNNVSLNSQT